MIRSLTGLIHTIAAVCALLSGIVIFMRQKATLFHKLLGYTYAVSMVVLIVTALSVYHLTKGFNILHFAAVVACFPLAGGLAAAIRRRPRGAWLARHYSFMAWSYIGLVAAFVAETSTRVVLPRAYAHFGPQSQVFFWPLVGIASLFVFLCGAGLLARNRKLIAKYGDGTSA